MNKMLKNKKLFISATVIGTILLASLSLGMDFTQKAKSLIQTDKDSASTNILQARKNKEILQYEEPLSDDAASVLKITDDDIVLGNPAAEITIMEYSSLSCFHCRQYRKKIFGKIKSNFIDTGKAKYISREYPFDRQSYRAAILTRCVHPKYFHQAMDTLFNDQNKWAFNRNFMPHLFKVAARFGLQPAEFDRCMADRQLKTKIFKNRQEGNNVLRLLGTPSIFINGKLIRQPISWNKINTEIKKQLATAN